MHPTEAQNKDCDYYEIYSWRRIYKNKNWHADVLFLTIEHRLTSL